MSTDPDDTPRRAALRRMVRMDEELEAEYPGWMDGPSDADAQVDQSPSGSRPERA